MVHIPTFKDKINNNNNNNNNSDGYFIGDLHVPTCILFENKMHQRIFLLSCNTHAKHESLHCLKSMH